ncbi:hypothetical protein KAR91_21845 [Candidatus Pacearchaeota archaeon]|nr:hypothetical protein [Candidatus Pacearchaeota archaeon]
MAVIEKIPDTPRGTTLAFTITLKFESGQVPDITADTVTLTIKENKDDADAASGVIQEDADVSTGGGVAIFVLTATQTDITPKEYFYDVVWTTVAGAVKVLDVGDDTFKILERISDP